MTDVRAELFAALDAEEAAARLAMTQVFGEPRQAGGEWIAFDDAGAVEDSAGALVVYDEGAPSAEQAAHIAAHDPASTLRRVAAVRAVVELHQPYVGKCALTQDRAYCTGCTVSDEWGYETPIEDCPTICALHEGWCGQ